MSDPIPRFSSADLHIAAWERLDHGGHSFVFKVSIDGTPSVIKIFRPQHVAPDYFTRESSSHARLAAAGLSGTLTPRVFGELEISPSHEAQLRAEGKLPVARRRRRGTLMALWMELLAGRRLALPDVLGEQGNALRRRVEGGLQSVHAAGVLQGDVKWRNIMVVGERVVWLDFSNAAVEEEGGEAWAVRVEDEMQALRWMLARGEVRYARCPAAAAAAAASAVDADLCGSSGYWRSAVRNTYRRDRVRHPRGV